MACCRSPFGVYGHSPTAALHSDSQMHLLRGLWAPPTAQSSDTHQGVHVGPRITCGWDRAVHGPHSLLLPTPCHSWPAKHLSNGQIKEQKKNDTFFMVGSSKGMWFSHGHPAPAVLLEGLSIACASRLLSSPGFFSGPR